MATGNDMKMAEATYSNFTSLVKWGSVIVGLVAAFVVFLIA